MLFEDVFLTTFIATHIRYAVDVYVILRHFEHTPNTLQ